MRNMLFPICAISLSIVAFLLPELFTPLKPYIVPLLIVVMLVMGITLSLNDFKNICNKKSALAFGVALQFIVMPIFALLISKVFNLNEQLTIGMMLVGTSAGGTASNVITYLARGNLALSISMTLLSTLCAIVLMPLLTKLYIGHHVPVDAWGMFISLIKITLIPIAIGVSINTIANKFIKKITPLMPTLSMISIVLIIAIIVALNVKNLQSVGIMVIFAVILHNALGLISGYFGSKLLRFDEKTARTIAIEVGMQNSGLSVALAIKYFTSLSSLPGALFSIWHNVSGALLASFWHNKIPKDGS